MDVLNNGWIQSIVVTALAALLTRPVCVLWDRMRAHLCRRYADSLRSKEFSQFSSDVLLLYYREYATDCVTVGADKVRLPIIALRAAGGLQYPFEEFDGTNPGEIGPDRRYRYQWSWQFPLYRYLVGKTIRRGWLQGFMLDRLLLDEARCVKGASYWVGTYDENVYTSHILQYELARAFARFAGKGGRMRRANFRMKLRDKINAACVAAMSGPLESGAGRASLLGVQMLVAVRNEEGGYSFLRIMRSSKVSASQGLYQFVPSGGFEVFDKVDQSELLDEDELKNHCSVRNAILREYVEELFGKEEFEIGSGEDPRVKIDNDPEVEHLKKLMAEGHARMIYLGNVMGLQDLRQEFSFLLIVDDPMFLRT